MLCQFTGSPLGVFNLLWIVTSSGVVEKKSLRFILDDVDVILSICFNGFIDILGNIY